MWQVDADLSFGRRRDGGIAGLADDLLHVPWGAVGDPREDSAAVVSKVPVDLQGNARFSTAAQATEDLRGERTCHVFPKSKDLSMSMAAGRKVLNLMMKWVI